MNPDLTTVGHISDIAKTMMRDGFDAGLSMARNRVDFLPFLMVRDDQHRVVEFFPEIDESDPIEVTVAMARRAVSELTSGVPYVIVRDAYFTHPQEGRTEAIIVEFGRAGGVETHYAVQRYGRSLFLRHFRLIGLPIRLAESQTSSRAP